MPIFFYSYIVVRNPVGLAFCRGLGLQDETDIALGLPELGVSLERQALDAHIDTHIIPYRTSALRGNHRGEEGLGHQGRPLLRGDKVKGKRASASQ